jgi:feruloyl esterase
MPAQHWNGRFLGGGNGGFAGSIDYERLSTAVRQGYAAAATDTGHSGTFVDAHWALGHPEKIVDFAYRAIHLMTVDSKAVLHLYYGRPPTYAYFESCSTGGRQGLMEAQRFPNDYSGILSGAPANNWTGLLTSFGYLSRALNLDPASYIPPDRLPVIQSAVLAACDAQDGVRDGVVNLLSSCRFDPAVLLCKNEPSAALPYPTPRSQL